MRIWLIWMLFWCPNQLGFFLLEMLLMMPISTQSLLRKVSLKLLRKLMSIQLYGSALPSRFTMNNLFWKWILISFNVTIFLISSILKYGSDDWIIIYGLHINVGENCFDVIKNIYCSCITCGEYVDNTTIFIISE